MNDVILQGILVAFTTIVVFAIIATFRKKKEVTYYLYFDILDCCFEETTTPTPSSEYVVISSYNKSKIGELTDFINKGRYFPTTIYQAKNVYKIFNNGKS